MAWVPDPSDTSRWVSWIRSPVLHCQAHHLQLVLAVQEIGDIFHRRISAQCWNAFLLPRGAAGNKNMVKFHIWVGWVWKRYMIDTGKEVHLGPIDIRQKMMLWALEPPNIIRKKGQP